MRLFLLLLLAAGCAAPPVGVDRQPGLDGSWSQGKVQLDVTGTTATLAFHGRILVFEGVDHVRGQITEKAVYLTAGRVRIEATEERIDIEDGKIRITRPLAALPAGSRFVYRDGDLKPR